MRGHPGAHGGIGPLTAPTWIALAHTGDAVTAVALDSAAAELWQTTVPQPTAAWVADQEKEAAPRWIWNDTARWYPGFLAAGVRLARCHDLRLCHAILRTSAFVMDATALRAATAWAATPSMDDGAPALFALDTHGLGALPDDVKEVLAEFTRQRRAIDDARAPGSLRTLVAVESAGALVAAELRAAGLPWNEAAHDTILTEVLGARPAQGGPPAKVQATADRTRIALNDPSVSLDSPPKLLRALHRAGVFVESTSQWELAEHQHPAIAPLLEYKKLSRLLSANGWTWLAEWVRDGRFRPVYVPAGVVTGRWASSGGGALQLPRLLRAAVRADPGWTLIVADVAQLEPRVLAAIAHDEALAAAAQGRDLYAGVVDAGIVATRNEAKLALLGAMYGATTGDSARLLPRLRRAYRRAMGLVDDAAATGERGGAVHTWLGRTSPEPSTHWLDLQHRAALPEARAADEARAQRAARDRGRFTRNFVVQGTAAEWALAWLAELRMRLAALPAAPQRAVASGPSFADRAHLAFFLHDEIIVHTPIAHAEAAASAVLDAAAAAGRGLFGDFPVDFRLDLRISEDAAKSAG
ncbi:MAG: bifunctional 3'-5' exonuclease/DNA polymerase, partial [Microbacterium sp.]|uniref:bifunctional 3'-5' exonuclease/DNA polymerase n=1 Tax=Microbacterium sp. TaxID=51671 RepID=UPI003A87AF97